MSEPYLSVSSDIGTVALNGVASSGTGAEAQPGVTGLGLPPIEAIFNEGAGDGAEFIGRRIGSRNMDLPVTMVGENRADLKAQMRTFAQVIMGDNVYLHWVDPGADNYRLKIQPVGGGDYVYGQDTTGEWLCRFSMTFRSEWAYWQREEPVTLKVPTTSSLTTVQVDNPGSVKAEPTWVVEGPHNGFQLRSEQGGVLDYRAPVPYGSLVRVNVARGTVTDQNGSSLYHNLGPLPRFGQLPAGPSEVTFERNTLGTLEAMGSVRYNYFPDPNFVTLQQYPNQDPAGPTYLRIRPGLELVPYGNGFAVQGKKDFNRYTEYDGSDPFVVQARIGGLPPNTNLVFSYYDEGPPELAGGNFRTMIGQVEGSTDWFGAMPTPMSGPGVRHSFPFTTGSTGSVTILVGLGGLKQPSGLESSWGFAHSFSITPDGGAFFSGASTDDAIVTHDWMGVAHQSTSRMTIDYTGAPAPELSAEFSPKEWLVI